MGRLTENEAIEKIREQICNEKGVQRYCRDNCMHGTEYCAYSMAIKALDKQIAKKPNYVQYDANPKIGNWHCPNCNSIVFKTVNRIGCIDCLQKLDWE